MGITAEEGLRDRIAENGGLLALPVAELYAMFGLAGETPAEARAVSTLLTNVGVTARPPVVELALGDSVNLTTASDLISLAESGESRALTPPATPTQGTVIQQQIVVGSDKSVFGAFLLGLFFGPLGMLYSTVPGAFFMFVVALFVGAATLGLGLLFVWPICAIWAAISASGHNSKLSRKAGQMVHHAGGATAGWYADTGGSGQLRWWDGNAWTNHYADRR